MIKDTIYFSENQKVRLDCYLHEPSHLIPYRDSRPAVIVCPGGGYHFLSAREADPIALAYLGAGFNSFVLHYTVDNAVYPKPLIDISKAVAFIRENAEKLGVIPENIAVCGFSAGGHLAASLGVHWKDDYVTKQTPCKEGDNKPNAMILGYPVISTSLYETENNLEAILGTENREWAYKEFNLQSCVNKDTPPAFLFHTFKDDLVPVADSLKFACSLEQNDIPFEMHIFPNGPHGLSLSNDDVCEDGGDKDAAIWFDASVKWLKRLFYNSKEATASVNRAKYTSSL